MNILPSNASGEGRASKNLIEHSRRQSAGKRGGERFVLDGFEARQVFKSTHRRPTHLLKTGKNPHFVFNHGRATPLPIADCRSAEIRKSKFETRKSRNGGRISSFGLRSLRVNRQSTIENRQFSPASRGGHARHYTQGLFVTPVPNSPF